MLDTIFPANYVTGAIPGLKQVNLQESYNSSSSVKAQHPTQHVIGYLRDDFYRPDNQTNSVKALKESSWSLKS